MSYYNLLMFNICVMLYFILFFTILHIYTGHRDISKNTSIKIFDKLSKYFLAKIYVGNQPSLNPTDFNVLIKSAKRRFHLCFIYNLSLSLIYTS